MTAMTASFPAYVPVVFYIRLMFAITVTLNKCHSIHSLYSNDSMTNGAVPSNSKHVQ